MKIYDQLNLAIDDFLNLLSDVPQNSNAKTDANELERILPPQLTDFQKFSMYFFFD